MDAVSGAGELYRLPAAREIDHRFPRRQGRSIRVEDKNGIVQLVNPVEVGSNTLSIGVTSPQYGQALMMYTASYLGIPTASAMSAYLSAVQLGTLEA